MLQKPWTEKHLKLLSSAGKKEIQEREIEIKEMVDESQECHETVSLGFNIKARSPKPWGEEANYITQRMWNSLMRVP